MKKQDFKRDVYCLFGLPVDNLTIASTKKLLRDKISQGNSTVLSTINVNWVIQSFSDRKFRKEILNSDIVTLDGKPLLWLAKLLGYPMRETVSGSTLLQELNEEKIDKPLSLFLFGGEQGAAELAMQRVNMNQGGLKAVGALNPGFGTVEQMSTDAIIRTINLANPDILLVALGAKKGTQWIAQNRHRLNARIISHLGATINFLAGTVKRAPVFMQGMGMEWLWRIFCEPKLFSRYASDGMKMLRMLISCFSKWPQIIHLNRYFGQQQPNTKIGQKDYSDKIVLLMEGNLMAHSSPLIQQAFDKCISVGKDITLDFKKTKFADGTFLGVLLLFGNCLQNNGNTLIIINANSLLLKIFDFYCIPKHTHSFEINP